MTTTAVPERRAASRPASTPVRRRWPSGWSRARRHPWNASGLTDDQWQRRLPKDGRKVGVIVHHVAYAYPIEIHLAQPLATGRPVVGVTMDVIDEINANHAEEYDQVTKEETLDLLRRNSAMAAAVIRALSDEELDGAAAVSLYSDAPLTCQFVHEDHAVRHSYHHLARLRAALTT